MYVSVSKLLLMPHSSLRTLAARWTTSLQHLRSQTICNTLFVDKSVQSVMSLIQARGGLPLRLLPGILPVMMPFSKLSVVFLIRCPKYCSFLFTSIPGSCLPPAFRSTSSLVCFDLSNKVKSSLFSSARIIPRIMWDLVLIKCCILLGSETCISESEFRVFAEFQVSHLEIWLQWNDISRCSEPNGTQHYSWDN